MIQTKLVGGLGNQLFQWACARNLQKLYGHKLQYDDHIEYSNRKRDIYRFMKLKLDNPDYVKDAGDYSQFVRVVDSFSYDNFKSIDFSNLSVIYYLDGYWQGEKYFKESEDEIRSELQPSKEFFDEYQIPDNSLSLHVRRTDYLNLQDYHPVQTLSYYESAIDILNHTGNIYVFSDDIEWCKQNFKFKNMHFIHNQDPILDLWMMSACEKNVIANSTFSWWAAWINGHSNKQVVCPKNWFGPKAPYSDKDILDNNWIKL